MIYFKPDHRSMATVGQFSYSFCLTCHASAKSEQTFSALENLDGKNAFSNEGRATIVAVETLFPRLGQSAMPDTMAPMPRLSTDPAFLALYRNADIYPYSEVPHFEAEAKGKVFPSTDWDHVWNKLPPTAHPLVPKDVSPYFSYITSDNCIACHDATLLVETEVPNMLVQSPKLDAMYPGQRSQDMLNLSIYGEWRASPMGMAGRDPIFFAQLQSEMDTYPQHSLSIQNLCLSCHGAMGQRQHQADNWDDPKKQNDFSLEMVFKTGEEDGGNYGALAREGISCMICHQMDIEKLIKEHEHSGRFSRGPWDVVHGPTSPKVEAMIDHQVVEVANPGGPIRTRPMKEALGVTPQYDKHLKSSEMCGACHTIKLPVYPGRYDPGGHFRGTRPVDEHGAPLMSVAHEQDTYSEWVYSAYNQYNPAFAEPRIAPKQQGPFQTCQDCHMRSTFEDDPTPLNFKIANVQNTSWPLLKAKNLAPANEITVPTRKRFKRHTFFGMNLFVLNMYEQLGSDVFGMEMDPNPPVAAVDSHQFAIEQGEWQIRNETADLEIIDLDWQGNELVAKVRVTNKAGHRFPSGVGFRRAWIELAVLDRDRTPLWSSGQTDSQGVIKGPDGGYLNSEFTVTPNEIQPHYEVISRQDQVQIYEERYVNQYLDGKVRLNTSFLGIGKVIKDHRILPRGYATPYIQQRRHAAKSKEEGWKWNLLLPLLPKPGFKEDWQDEAYWDGSGSDTVAYRIPAQEIAGAWRVEVRLNYQSIPPYYLRDRFATGKGAQTQRLFYVAGHLSTHDTAIANWKIEVAAAGAPAPAHD